MGTVNGHPMRNDNVLYEVGLAHAARLPAEVVLFRSDRDQLMVDVVNIRVNSYDPDRDPGAAREALTRLFARHFARSISR